MKRSYNVRNVADGETLTLRVTVIGSRQLTGPLRYADFLDRERGKLRRVLHPCLRDLDYFLSDHLGYRVISINKTNGAQSLLVRSRQAADVFRPHRYVLQ
jgi:hypothetical protein